MVQLLYWVTIVIVYFRRAIFCMHQTAQKYAYANIQKIKSKKKNQKYYKEEKVEKIFSTSLFFERKNR